MTTALKPSIPLSDAVHLANSLRVELLPYCERVWVGGSVRRRKPFVGDIELVCIPKRGVEAAIEEAQSSLFEAAVPVAVEDQLTAYLAGRITAPQSPWSFRLNTLGRQSFGPKNKLLNYNDCPVDLFSGTWANFGMLFFVRTGDADWVREVMALLKRQKRHGHPYGGVGYLIPSDNARRQINAEYLCVDEERVFELLGWPFVNPSDRTEQTAVEIRRTVS